MVVVWSGGSDQSWSASNNPVQHQEFLETARYVYFDLLGGVVIGSNREKITQISGLF